MVIAWAARDERHRRVIAEKILYILWENVAEIKESSVVTPQFYGHTQARTHRHIVDILLATLLKEIIPHYRCCDYLIRRFKSN